MYQLLKICRGLALAVLFITFIFNTCTAQLPVKKEYLTGHFNYRGDTSFVRVAGRYSDRTVYLRRATYAAYQKMYADALKDGVCLTIISGTRSFTDQVCKWQSKWGSFSGMDQKDRVLAIMRYSSMPGTSRHHWGTDIDLTSLKPAFYKTQRGIKMYNWLTKNAARYGFYQPFTANRNSGYQEEKWHWSYAPLAKNYLQQYTKYITYNDIKGFPGSQYAGNINVIQNWVRQVNPQCM